MPSWAASWLCCVPDVMNLRSTMEMLPSWTGNFLIGPMAEAGSTGQAEVRVPTHRFSTAWSCIVQTPVVSLHQNPSYLGMPTLSLPGHYCSVFSMMNVTCGISNHSPGNTNFEVYFFLPSKLSCILAPGTRLRRCIWLLPSLPRAVAPDQLRLLQMSRIGKLIICKCGCAACAYIP